MTDAQKLERKGSKVLDATRDLTRYLAQLNDDALSDPIIDTHHTFLDIVDDLQDTVDVYRALVDGKLLPTALDRAGVGTLSDELDGSG